ncbi:MAG: tyrosine-type recombinase/integrase [Pseudolabrys sp.]|nr:tyrosine-type recombinase/integrase [Pseudolabrys sp.]MDP2295457.1 tyrosine-type recombinase/integrase [Pseudolabrys sp.]
MIFTDTAIKRIPFATSSAGIVHRDSKTPGLMLRVGMKRKTFRYQSEGRENGHRKTISRKLGEWPHVKADQARARVLEIIGERAVGKFVITPPRGVTLAEAFVAYKATLRTRWLADCEGIFKRCLGLWEHQSLADISNSPEKVRDWHLALSKKRGPVQANNAARLLRATYRHAQKFNRSLPAMHPATGVQWNKQERANRAIPFAEFPAWAAQVDAIEEKDALRAAYHRLCVLTGMRPGELARLRWDGVDCAKRKVVIGKTKTGIDIEIPMSLPIVRQLKLARAAGRIAFEARSNEWVFPGPGKDGHLIETHERHRKLTHSGNAGRHTYRTVAAQIGVNELDIRLLLGHSLVGVSQGYITRALLVGSSLRAAQRKISARMMQLMKG